MSFTLKPINGSPSIEIATPLLLSLLKQSPLGVEIAARIEYDLVTADEAKTLAENFRTSHPDLAAWLTNSGSFHLS